MTSPDLTIQANTKKGGQLPPPALGVAGWVAFDWAVIPCFGLVMMFVYAPYFTTQIIGDPVNGQAVWGFVQAAASLLIALASPIMGAAADAAGPRKPFIAAFTLSAIAAMTALFFIRPAGGEFVVATGALCLIVFAISVEYGLVFHNSMLPSLVSGSAIGRLSAWSYATGYIGTVISLVLIGALAPATIEISGLGRLEKERLIGPAMAIWMAIFIAPFFLFTPDKPRQLALFVAVGVGVRALGRTIRQARTYTNVWLYLLARMVFYDGLLAIFVFSGVFAAALLGWATPQLALLGALQFLASAFGALIGGFIDDKFGSKRTLIGAVLAVALMTFGMVSITPDAVFGVPAATLPALHWPSRFGFSSSPEQIYLIVAALSSMFAGPALSASRTMVVRLSPPDMIGQFFGLFSLLGRATAFLAPLAVGAVTAATGNLRLGFATVILFLVVGVVLLLFVKEQRSQSV